MDEATFNCPHCGALYAIMVGQHMATMEGRAHCQVCRREMIRWNTPSPPSFRLIKRAEDRNKPGSERGDPPRGPA